MKGAAESLDQPVAEPWVSVDVVVTHLGVARDSVYRWIDSEELPAHRIDKLWKCKRPDGWVRAAGTDETSVRSKRMPARKDAR